MILLVQITRSRVRLGRLRRDARPILDPRICALAEDVQRRIRLKSGVELLSSGAVATPVAFGIRRPAVMLPAGASSWPSEQLRSVLTHEMAHLRRRDSLTLIVGEMARAAHWYDPLVWYAFGRLMLERERACDDEVVQGGARGIDYADHLLSMARIIVHPRAHPKSALTLAEISGLKARVTALLTPAVCRGRLSPTQRGWVVAHSMVAVSAMTLVGTRQDALSSSPVPVLHDARQSAKSPSRVAAQPELQPHRQRTIERTPAAGSMAPSSWDRATASNSPIQHANPEQTERASGPTVTAEDPNRDPLADPRSELVALANPRLRWPSDEEIGSAKERDLIMGLRVAAEHVKRSEFDLVRERAEWALTRVRRGEIVAPLVESLQDRDWRIQAYAAWALTAIDAPGAAESIRPLLDHPNWRVRAQAASSLLGLRATLPMEVLQRLARDPAWQVRISVVEFLQRVGGADARHLLEGMLDDPHGGTRRLVEAALAERASP
jgi:hypothetical protein